MTITDIADISRTARYATGYLTVNVLGVPEAPGQPSSTGKVASHEATLAWTAPATNGLPIDYYDVTWSGGTQRCAASPCTITDLTNGTAYSFTVVAHNGVGDSPPSRASAPITPNAVPGEPGNPRTRHPADGSIEVAWDVPPVDGTPVTKYLVSWPGGSTETSATSVVATGLDNNAETTFTIKAFNDAGWGPGATTTGQSAGRPPRPDTPKLTSTEIHGGEQQAVEVSWAAVPPNGPGPTTYTVRRSGGGGTLVICDGIQDTSCTAPTVITDGTSYSYTVTASNPFYDSLQSDPATLVAAGTPGDFTALDATATGVSKQVLLTFTSPAAHDSGLTITCDADGVACGTWNAPADPTPFAKTITVADNGAPAHITLTAHNSTGTSIATVTSDTVYGPLGDISVTGLTGQGPYAAFTVVGRPARPRRHHHHHRAGRQRRRQGRSAARRAPGRSRPTTTSRSATGRACASACSLAAAATRAPTRRRRAPAPDRSPSRATTRARAPARPARPRPSPSPSTTSPSAVRPPVPSGTGARSGVG